jgi:hypothetical protein
MKKEIVKAWAIITVLVFYATASFSQETITPKTSVECNSIMAVQQSNKSNISLIVTKTQAEKIIQAHKEYYTQMLSLEQKNTANNTIEIKLIPTEDKYFNIIARLLTVSEIKTIRFIDKEASLQEIFF